VAEIVRTLQDLSVALDGEIAGGFAIIDRTLFDGARPGYRTIEMRASSWRGDLLGSFGEYPESQMAPLRFAPRGSIRYDEILPVIEALRSHGVVIEGPAS
jgi:hypothetical protein